MIAAYLVVVDARVFFTALPILIHLSKLCSSVLFALCRFARSVFVRVALTTTPCTTR
jgi:hypothetical protein